MDKPGTKVALLLFSILACGSVAAENPIGPAAGEIFLSALEASWQGRAELTPIGPRPYDITFERSGDRKVIGSTGNATVHHWAFYQQDNNLTIRFLSTFGGNRDPIYLHAEESDESGVLFRAIQPELLSVRVSVSARLLSIDVFHWDQPHVSIRLTRKHRGSEH